MNLAFDSTRIDKARNLATLLAAFPPNTLVPAARGNPGDSLTNYENPFDRRIQANRAGAANSDVWGVSGTLTIYLGGLTLKSISAYRSLQSNDKNLDLDGTPYDLFTILTRDERQDQFSQELQAFGDALDQRLSWIGGLYYFDESGEFAQGIQAIAPLTLNPAINLPRGTAEQRLDRSVCPAHLRDHAEVANHIRRALQRRFSSAHFAQCARVERHRDLHPRSERARCARRLQSHATRANIQLCAVYVRHRLHGGRGGDALREGESRLSRGRLQHARHNRDRPGHLRTRTRHRLRDRCSCGPAPQATTAQCRVVPHLVR